MYLVVPHAIPTHRTCTRTKSVAVSGAYSTILRYTHCECSVHSLFARIPWNSVFNKRFCFVLVCRSFDTNVVPLFRFHEISLIDIDYFLRDNWDAHIYNMWSLSGFSFSVHRIFTEVCEIHLNGTRAVANVRIFEIKCAQLISFLSVCWRKPFSDCLRISPINLSAVDIVMVETIILPSKICQSTHSVRSLPNNACDAVCVCSFRSLSAQHDARINEWFQY